MHPPCKHCGDTVYPMEKILACDGAWHKRCFRCQECGITLNVKSMVSANKLPYCKVHVPVARGTAGAGSIDVQRALKAPKRKKVAGVALDKRRTFKPKTAGTKRGRGRGRGRGGSTKRGGGGSKRGGGSAPPGYSKSANWKSGPKRGGSRGGGGGGSRGGSRGGGSRGGSGGGSRGGRPKASAKKWGSSVTQPRQWGTKGGPKRAQGEVVAESGGHNKWTSDGRLANNVVNDTYELEKVRPPSLTGADRVRADGGGKYKPPPRMYGDDDDDGSDSGDGWAPKGASGTNVPDWKKDFANVKVGAAANKFKQFQQNAAKVVTAASKGPPQSARVPAGQARQFAGTFNTDGGGAKKKAPPASARIPAGQVQKFAGGFEQAGIAYGEDAYGSESDGEDGGWGGEEEAWDDGGGEEWAEEEAGGEEEWADEGAGEEWADEGGEEEWAEDAGGEEWAEETPAAEEEWAEDAGGEEWADEGGEEWADEGGEEEWADDAGGEEWADEGGEEWADEGGEEWADEGGEEEWAEEGEEAELLFQVTAAYDYDAEGDDEISFVTGDVIDVYDNTDEGWWTGMTTDGQYGLFPVEYVET